MRFLFLKKIAYLLYYATVNWSISFYSLKLEVEILRLARLPAFCTPSKELDIARKRMKEINDE